MTKTNQIVIIYRVWLLQHFIKISVVFSIFLLQHIYMQFNQFRIGIFTNWTKLKLNKMKIQQFIWN